MNCSNCKEDWSNSMRENIRFIPEEGFYVWEGRMVICPFCPRDSRIGIMKDFEIRAKIVLGCMDRLKERYNVIDGILPNNGPFIVHRNVV